MNLSFTVTVTRCGECPHEQMDTDYESNYVTNDCSLAEDSKASVVWHSNRHALTATGPYACPMLKQVEQMKQEEK